jgi:hypothetical protein
MFKKNKTKKEKLKILKFILYKIYNINMNFQIFTEENKELLSKIFHDYIKPLNNNITYEQFCRFAFYHSY